MADGTWIQYNPTLDRYDASIDGGTNFNELDLKGQTKWSIQSVTATGTQNNFTVNSYRHVILDCTNASQLIFTGFAGANVEGDEILVLARGTGQIDFAHNSGSSLSANKLINEVTSCVTSLSGNNKGWARYQYISGTWKLVGHEQGDYISATSRTGVIAEGGGTLSATSFGFSKYKIQGKTLHWSIYVSWIPTGTVNAARLDLPVSGMSVAQGSESNIMRVASGATFDQAIAYVITAGDSSVSFVLRTNAGASVNFAGGSNSWLGNLFFQIN